ncbi:hypothetical protein [Microlunatus speluncae]|uniref:hypothetical protein n=1 Tax=Microlunatus speluncae TaxID=2594267 RepID=UPI0012663DB3|nr:hypothetical protein [Microlunatus speluncae]
MTTNHDSTPGPELPGEPEDQPRGASRRNALLIIGGVVVLLLITAGAIGIPALLRPNGGQVAQPAGPPTTLPGESAPDGWRTEQYRDVVFQVPADWGYAYEPGAAWCAGSDGKNPQPQHRKPYVALGAPQVIPAIACPEMPASMITEHVAAIQPADKRADGRFELGNGFWEVTNTVGAVKLRAVSKDADLAQQIVDTGAEAGKDALCTPEHALIKDPAARPKPAADVTSFGAVDRVALCQYEIGEGSKGLQAAAELSGDKAQRLVDGIAAAPVADPTECKNDPSMNPLDVTAVLRVQSSGTIREIILRQQGCPEGGDTVLGGFDDGTTVRQSTADTCRAVLVEPLQIQAGSGSVVQRCRA